MEELEWGINQGDEKVKIFWREARARLNKITDLELEEHLFFF